MGNFVQLLPHFCQKLDNFITQKPATLVCALSGGADSMALLLLLKHYAKQHQLKLIAVTIDHALRNDSSIEARQVSTWLEGLNTEHHIITWQHGNNIDSNIQSQARRARYELLVDFCKNHNAQHLFTAHTIDDQAETVLIRLMRGSSVDGLSAMKEVSNLDGIKLIRPLLSVSKNQLIDYLKLNNQQWVEDPSNKNERFLRVNIRNFLNSNQDKELITQRLAQTAENMQRVQDFLASEEQKYKDQIAHFADAGFCTIDISLYKAVHNEIAYRLLSNILHKIAGNYYKPRFEKIKRLHQAIISGDYHNSGTLYGCKVSFKQDKLTIHRELAAITEIIHLNDTPKGVWDKRFVYNYHGNEQNLILSALGKEHYQTIKKHVTPNNLNTNIIYGLPALKKHDQVVYVPYINYLKDGFKAEDFYIIFNNLID